MLINKDGSFEYEISSIPLKASGLWELEDNILSFHYNLHQIQVVFTLLNLAKTNSYYKKMALTMHSRRLVTASQ